VGGVTPPLGLLAARHAAQTRGEAGVIKQPLRVKTRIPLWQPDVSFRRLRTFRRMRLYARSAIGEDRLLDHLVGAGEQRRRHLEAHPFAVLRLITNLIGAWTGSARQIGLPVIGVLQLPCWRS
jgi:hypothetical protein